MNKSKCCVYIMFNLKTKRAIVGSTSRTIYDRFKEHLKGSFDKLSRRAANYIMNLGIEHWIIIPLETNIEKTKLKEKEGIWAKIFSHLLINNPIERSQTKPTSYHISNYKHLRNLNRAIIRNMNQYNWRSYCYTILHTNVWKTWNSDSLINILINLNFAKLCPTEKRKVSYRIRNFLRKEKKIFLRPYYSIKLLHAENLDKTKIKSVIQNHITNKNQDPLTTYISKRIKIEFENTHSIYNLVNNHRKILDDFSLERDITCLCRCQDKDLDLFPKDEKGHIRCRANDLPNELGKLRDILTISSKNPVEIEDKKYYGFQFRILEKFFLKHKLTLPWTNQFNESFFQQIRRKKRKKLLSRDKIREEIAKYQDKICFVPMDKNASTWSLMCPKEYIEAHRNEFSNKTFYQEINSSLDETKNIITKNYRNKCSLNAYKNGRSNKIKFITKKTWSLNSAFLLPKSKDLFRFRPIVSYKNFITHDIGNKFARCLTLMIKETGKYWNTMEMSETKRYKKIITDLNHINSWKSKFENEEITLLHFDVEKMFTNLSKSRVTRALEIMGNFLTKYRNTRELSFAIRIRKYEKNLDHFGLAYRYHEVQIYLTELMEYVDFELSNTYFTIGNKTFIQKSGLPMGGLLSACLASIDLMVQEFLLPHLWRNSIKGLHLFCRFRDDIFIIVGSKLKEEEELQIHTNLNNLYGPELSVKKEKTATHVMNFLEYNVLLKEKELILTHENKNFSNEGKFSRKIVRYPESYANHPPHIFTGIITGAIKRAWNSSSKEEYKILAIINVLREFLELNYNRRWLMNGLNKSHLPIFVTTALRRGLRNVNASFGNYHHLDWEFQARKT